VSAVAVVVHRVAVHDAAVHGELVGAGEVAVAAVCPRVARADHLPRAGHARVPERGAARDAGEELALQPGAYARSRST